jgi:hypothetical protein
MYGMKDSVAYIQHNAPPLQICQCRQKRELDQLVEYEVKRTQIQAKAEAKLAKQEERAAAQLQQKEAKEKAWRDALREQELQRLAAEKEEEAAIKAEEKVGCLLFVYVDFPSTHC